MVKMASKKKEQVQNAIASMVVDSEYMTAKRNMDVEISRFESLIEQLECQRNEKDYDWMSDYYLPVMNSIFHTERAGEVAQYFPTRDFVDVKLDGTSPTYFCPISSNARRNGGLPP